MVRHCPHQHIGHGVRISAAMRVNDALRIASRTRCVVERDRIPFVGRHVPCVIGIALRKKNFVVERADPFPCALVHRIVNVDDQQLAIDRGQRRLDRRREFTIGDQNLRFPVIQLKCDRRSIEPRVQRV